ncbi:amidohydrolase family protein [Rubellimicrobium sp. CFH 75288]|uniref:amidohydrolase family protein n=1 Tax=Rubellimicrobium sp. CFH 75288 TaxID=2697034 RepID=UPI001412273D|nr:amidohydrolase family protein [Rubellimicrobium sp. CFH 75288]
MSAVLEVGRLWARPWEGPPGGPARIVMEGGRIARIEPGGTGTGLALPGLVNAHDHARGLRPLAGGVEDGPLEGWLWRLRGLPGLDPWLNAAVAFGRMARSGVTAVADLHLPVDPLDPGEAGAVARAARDVGLTVAFVAPVVDRNLDGLDGGRGVRAALGPAAYARLERPLPPAAEQVALADAAAEALGDERFVVQYGPAGPHWVGEAGWRLLAARAAETGRRVHTHLLETAAQRDWLDREHGGRPLDWLEGLGLLGPGLTVAHGVHLRPDECRRLAGAGALLAVNASSNLRLASGVAPGAAIAAAGLAFGIGLDGLALGDDEDMLAEIRLAAALLRGWGPGAAGPGPAEIWRAAASWGWRAIDGRDGEGLREGARADVVVLEEEAMMGDRLDEDPSPALILGRMRREAVREVWAGGRPIVRGGWPLGIDLPALERELLAQARRARPDAALRALAARAAAVAEGR